MSKKQVIFFIGKDITAHLIMNRVVKDMMVHGEYEPVLYYAKNTTLKGADLPELREFGFFEKTLLNETVYPFINKKPSHCQPNLSPDQLAEKYELEMGTPLQVSEIDDVNAPDFVNKIRANPNIACAVSVRCTQIFRPEIVAAVKANAPFLNLHSGLLPEYRGVMPTMRRMFDIATGKVIDRNIGCTLHKVDGFDPSVRDKGIDTGKILSIQSIELDPTHSGYLAGVSIVDAGSDAITDALKYLQKGRYMHEIAQDNTKSTYYTFPTTDELCEWKKAGVVLVRPDDAITTLVNAFSKAGTKHGDKLEAVMKQAIKQWYTENCSCGIKDSVAHAIQKGCVDAANDQRSSAFGMIIPGHALALNN